MACTEVGVNQCGTVVECVSRTVAAMEHLGLFHTHCGTKEELYDMLCNRVNSFKG